MLLSLGLTALALAFGGRADAAAPFAAGATVNPATQYLDDSAGSMLTFTVANTGTTSSIGAVEINRPDGSFKLTQCPLAPFGWKVQAAETKCRYRSADGTADDIKPGKSASFSVRSKTDPGTQDRTGVWNVQVSKTNQFDAGSMTAASGSPTTKVHSFQVLDAGVAGGPASPGSACPVLSHAETTAATRNIVVCGRNRASLTLAPNAANSSLAGTWLGAPGTFSSAGVPPSASSRVLGTWQGAAISSSFGPGKSVIAKIGSAANRTSPSTTLTGYEGLNRPPDAAADSATTDEDTASGQIDVLANDSDPDPGDTFSITGHDTTGSTGGTVSQVGNKFVFDPNGNFEDLAPTEHRDSLFTYTVTDNHGASSAGTVTVTVTGLNDATTAVADTASTPENATKVINVLGNDTDPDTNQTLAVVSVDITGTKGAVTNNGDNVTYDPNGQFSSLGPGDTDTDTFKYKANDGVGDSNTATVTVTITGTNSSPVVSNVEGTALAYDTGTTATVSPGVTVTDADTTPLTGATVSITAGYANGNDTLALPAPVGPITGSFNTSNGVLTLDGDGTPAQYQSALQSVTYHATEPTASGSRTVQFQVNDGETVNNFSNTPTRAITVTHLNHAPTGVADGASTNEGAATSPISVLANDTDVDNDSPLHISSADTTSAKGATVTDNGNGTLTYDPSGKFESLGAGATDTDTFTYKAADPSNADSAATTVTVTITGINDAPVLANVEGTALAYSSGDTTAVSPGITASDVDSPSLSFATATISSGYVNGKDTLALPAPVGPITGAFNPTSGVLTLSGAGGTPAEYQTALQSVTFHATDATPDGSRTVQFLADDGATLSHASNTVSRDITVTHFNHPPTGVADAASTNEGAATSPISVLANDTDSDNDTPLHLASADTTSAKGGTVTNNGDGTVTYDPNGKFESLGAGATDTDTFTYKAADPSNAESAPTTVTVTITGINDAPVLASAESDNPDMNSGATGRRAITATLTASDADSPNLTSAKVSITTGFDSANHDDLIFIDANNIFGNYNTGTGVLTLTGSSSVANYQAALRSVEFQTDSAAPTANRVFTFQADDGAAANHASNTVVRALHVVHYNAPPVANNDTYSGALGNTKLAVSKPVASTDPHTTVTGKVLDNDTDDETPGTMTVVLKTATAGAKVTMDNDGAFTYVPPVGLTGPDTFTYTVSDNDLVTPKTADGTVTINIATTTIWYVNNTAAAGDGRSDSPLNVLTGATGVNGAAGAGDVDDPGDIIFLYQGSGTYAGGLPLETTQQLIGEPQGLNVASTQLVAAGGTNPVVVNGSGDAITLANGVVVQRVSTGTSTGHGIAGLGVTDATVGSGTVISGAGGGAVSLTGAAGGNITIGSTITNTAGPAVVVSNRTGGTTALTAAITDSGSGILLTSNAGTINLSGTISETGAGGLSGSGNSATINVSGTLTTTNGGVSFLAGSGITNFTNTLSLTGTGATKAFSMVSAGTVTVTASATNALTTATGMALEIQDTTIGAGGVTFRKVAAGNSSGGPANGILLKNTGSTAGLSVSGVTNTADSGGIIEKTTGHAVSLTNTKSPSLSWMKILNPAHAGIKGAGVDGFTLTRSTIDGAGAAQNDVTDSSVAFNNTAGGLNNNVQGLVTITNNTLSNAYGGGVDIFNYNGTISDANITGNAISSSANPALSTGGAITLNLFGSASTVASLTKAEINTNTITNFPGGPGIKVQGAQTTSSGAPAGNYGTPSGAPGTGSNIVQIHNNLVTGDATNKLNGNAIEASVTGKGVGNFDITGNGTVANPITNILGQGIAIGAAGSVTATFNVVNNNLSQLNNSLNSDGIGLGIDKNTQSDASTLANPTVKATIDNNMVGATEGAGIHELLRDSDAVVELRLIRNTVTTAPVNPFFSGIELTSGSSGSPTYDPTLCAQIGGAGTGNTSPPGAVNGADQRPGIVLNKRSTSATTYVFGIVGFTPAPPNTTQVEAYVTSQNPGSGLGAGVYAGKRVSVNTGDNYTGCALSF